MLAVVMVFIWLTRMVASLDGRLDALHLVLFNHREEAASSMFHHTSLLRNNMTCS